MKSVFLLPVCLWKGWKRISRQPMKSWKGKNGKPHNQPRKVKIKEVRKVDKVKKILVPVDFSEMAAEAINAALVFARAFDARIYLLHVVHEPADTAGFYFPHISLDKLHEDMKEGAQKMMRNLVIDTMDTYDNFETAIISGIPYRKIVQYARDFDMDLIVMGAVGRTGLDRAFFGSTVDKVIKSSGIPVLAVKAAMD
jgi:nucleotide-binding universal stress UspA family protein